MGVRPIEDRCAWLEPTDYRLPLTVIRYPLSVIRYPLIVGVGMGVRPIEDRCPLLEPTDHRLPITDYRSPSPERSSSNTPATEPIQAFRQVLTCRSSD